MTGEYTPGPWLAVPMVNGAKGAYYIVGNRNGNNAEVELAQVGPTLSPHADANARLIAAAPDLLEALRKLSFAAQTTGGTAGRDDGLVQAIDFAAAAIAKARGAA